MQNDPKRAEVDDRENYYPRLALIAGLIGIIAIVWLVNSSRASEPTAAAPAAPAVTERYGNPDVWDRIEYGTDCDQLQVDWDTAMDNAEARQRDGIHDRLTTLSLDYAAAASQRMRDLGC